MQLRQQQMKNLSNKSGAQLNNNLSSNAPNLQRQSAQRVKPQITSVNFYYTNLKLFFEPVD